MSHECILVQIGILHQYTNMHQNMHIGAYFGADLHIVNLPKCSNFEGAKLHQNKISQNAITSYSGPMSKVS